MAESSLMLPLLAFVMTIFTSWMLGLHTDTVSIYHTVYTTYIFTMVCVLSLFAVTESPYKSNFCKMFSIQLFFPFLGWLIVSILKFASREQPIWDVTDSDFVDVLSFFVVIAWQSYLSIKGMPTYYELFYFGTFEKPSTLETQTIKGHKLLGYTLGFLYCALIIVLCPFQESPETIIHIILNFLPLSALFVVSSILMVQQRQRSDAKVFTGSNYSFMWIALLFQLSLIIQSVAFLTKYASYDKCSDCYLGMIYFLSSLPLSYYVFFGFQKFTIKHEKIPKYFYEEQVLFFTRTAPVAIAVGPGVLAPTVVDAQVSTDGLVENEVVAEVEEEEEEESIADKPIERETQ